MLIRALIVFLAILNLGVAAWWLSRSDDVAPDAPPQRSDVPGLQLLTETMPAQPAIAPLREDATAVAPEADKDEQPAAAVAAVPSAPVAANRCYVLGPFASDAAARAAATRAGALTTRVREEPGSASAYTVVMPPLADRAAAQDVAQRIGAAGFDDFLVINTGELANGIALGRYGSRESAQRRQAALQAAGFTAQLQPVGQTSATEWWAEVSLPAGASDGQGRAVDCATLR